ncbi:MAG: sigma-70 family RNA polymerase sigma factor [Planctomycetaceae bacterium]|nr:sigma-70 family RNA polymerase sigma factor [Planctomycetaceae bacterium]
MSTTKSTRAIRTQKTPFDHHPEIEYIRSDSFSDLDRRYACVEIDELCQLEPIQAKIREVDLNAVETGLSTYLAELHKVPLLKGDEEYQIFQWMNYLKYRAAQRVSGRKRATQKLRREVNLLLHRARQFRNLILSANLRLVVSIAKKLVDRDNPIEDLISDGHLPLMRSVEIFDFERGTRFSTYATWAVRNKLYRSTPRNRKQSRRFRNGSDDLFPFIADESERERSFESYHLEIQDAVKGLLSQLDERDKYIVQARFGMNDQDKPHRFREIAEGLNISTERVRQLLARSLDQLREHSERLAIEVA